MNGSRQSGVLVLLVGALSACTGPGLEPPFGASPTLAPGSGGTLSATGGLVDAEGGEQASSGGLSSAVTGGSAAPTMPGDASGGGASGATGGTSTTGGDPLLGASGSDAGVLDLDTCVRFEPALEPCVLVLPSGMMPSSGAPMRVVIGMGETQILVPEVVDGQSCAPDGYFLEQLGADLRVVLCPVSCVRGATAPVRAESGCELAMPAAGMDAGG